MITDEAERAYALDFLAKVDQYTETYTDIAAIHNDIASVKNVRQGLGCLGIGVAVTLFTLLTSNPREHYYILLGPIVFGLWRLGQGIMQRRETSPSLPLPRRPRDYIPFMTQQP